MVVKHHQNRHKIHRRCTFIHSIHNWKYFCEPTFVYVHIGQDGDYCSEFDYLLYKGGLIDIATMKVKFYMYPLCKFLTSFLNLSLNEAFKLNTKSTSEISKLDLDCSGGIYLEVTFSPGNSFIST